MKHYLTIEDEKGRSVLSSKVIRGGIKVSATEEQILRELTFCPQYPAQLAKKLGTSPANIEDALQTLFQAAKIKTAELGEFRKFLKTALRHSPDKNDAPYIALALKLGCPLWSNDKALKKQEKAIVISTEELLEQQNSFD